MHTRLNELPFSSDRKMMTTLNYVNEQEYLYTKGAIDRVLPRCSKILVDGKEVQLTEKYQKQIIKNANSFSEGALRVIVFAYKKHEGLLLSDEDEKDLVFIGAVGIIDPPREGVADAIKLAKKAGIKVVMITGDHPLTAKVIADQLGILSPNGGVMTGDELNQTTDEELLEKVKSIDVFARVNPNHKTRIVTALQKNNLTVAMTGDGVNDSPSLRKADVGIAMGQSGSDAAKEAADVILADDNFSSIINGVVEGRNAYQKIKRATAFLLAANPQVIAMFIVIL
ncbi:hypothetical protein Zmor_012032 [Zophobas morio]|uniref:Uncharacterized protein n=1 Tax=Zophobas morio TaxID=2755281 RepID=A0AA38LZ81_9CUCU|nr:hypothetical protein Zmor_012032 [Zophobas morio]